MIIEIRYEGKVLGQCNYVASLDKTSLTSVGTGSTSEEAIANLFIVMQYAQPNWKEHYTDEELRYGAKIKMVDSGANKFASKIKEPKFDYLDIGERHDGPAIKKHRKPRVDKNGS